MVPQAPRACGTVTYNADVASPDYLTILARMNVLVAVEGGQLYAAPAHRLTPDTLPYLEQHAPAIAAQLGTCRQAGDDLSIYQPVGEKVLFMTPGSRGPHVSPMRPGFLGGDEELPEPSPAQETAAPTRPARPCLVDQRVIDVHVPLPMAVSRLLDALRSGRLPKGTHEVAGERIADLEGYVQIYAINLLIGDQVDALKRLNVAAQILEPA